jgi:hypothetical protein
MSIDAQATQDFVPVKEIRDGIIVLNTGELRALVLVSPINLSLKTSEEQEAVFSQFMSFLNSLDFSTQIVVQSRRLDITPYLLTLEKRYEAQTEPLLKIQTKQYIEFIRDFTDQNSIMTKTFIVVVPYGSEQLAFEKPGFFSGLFGSPKKSVTVAEKKEFEESRTQLEQRIGLVQGGLGSCNLSSSVLNTDEATDVLYKVFNPGDRRKAINFE